MTLFKLVAIIMKFYQTNPSLYNDPVKQADLRKINEIFKKYSFKQLSSLEALTADEWFDHRDEFFRQGDLYAWDIARWIAIDRLNGR